MKNLELRNVREEIVCFICSQELHLFDIAALRCGHTFHPQCVLLLVNIFKKCPVCKKQAQEDSIIPRLFLEIGDKDVENTTTSDNKNEELLTEETLNNLNQMEMQVRLASLQIEHNIASIEMLKKGIEKCLEIYEKRNV
ncbi:unnamed protein product [Cercopithifilaria johnstoni]|uniref:RING-type domain-containing protein n=1 Tax=Cercopithifilaria johnstoni TaxID=2874296 RepID=A0A8J2MS23_9BILA|nr:unnamed protein product [Cercopithifilaria johnstoni]